MACVCSFQNDIACLNVVCVLIPKWHCMSNVGCVDMVCTCILVVLWIGCYNLSLKALSAIGTLISSFAAGVTTYMLIVIFLLMILFTQDLMPDCSGVARLAQRLAARQKKREHEEDMLEHRLQKLRQQRNEMATRHRLRERSRSVERQCVPQASEPLVRLQRTHATSSKLGYRAMDWDACWAFVINYWVMILGACDPVLSALQRFELIWKDWDKCNNNNNGYRMKYWDGLTRWRLAGAYAPAL